MNACFWTGCGADDVFIRGPEYVEIMVRSGRTLWQVVDVIYCAMLARRQGAIRNGDVGRICVALSRLSSRVR